MDNSYGEAFAETLEIIEHSKKEIKDKISPKFIELLKNNKSMNYKVNIDFSDENWIKKIKTETRILMGLIYRDYIVSPEEREKLIKY